MSVEAGAGPRVVTRRPRSPVVSIALSLIVTAVDLLLLALALGGLDAVFRYPKALALLAVWAVTGMILALLRPVRSQDVVTSTRESRGTLIGLGLIPLLLPAICALGERQGIWPIPGGEARGWAGVGLAAAGLTLRIAAMAQLGSRFSPLVAVQREHALETRGLYARTRHPGYLGAWLASLGVVLAFGSGLGAIPLALFTALIAGRVRREDALLEAHFGDAFRSYRARTGGLVPRIGASG